MTRLVGVYLSALACLAQDVPRGTGWVVIPVQEYVALRSRATPPEIEPAGAPVEATLSKVEYELKVKDGVASGHANLTVDVLKDGWVRVPIPSGLLVKEARLAGKPVSLVNGAAMLSARGRSVLALEVAIGVNASGGEERLALPASGSGVTRASLAVARPGVDVKVTGGILTDQTEGSWLAYGRGNEPLVFAWRRKDPVPEEARAGKPVPLRLRGSLVQMVGLGEDGSSISAEVNLEVIQGSVQQVKLRVPDGITVNQVPGATVADWEVKNGELAVGFLDSVDKAAKFVIQGEMKLAREGAIDVPLLRLEGVERETGGIAVEVLGAGEIRDRKLQGLEAVEAAELGQPVSARQSPSLAAFRLRPGAQAWSLNVTVARYAQQALLTAMVEDARYRVLLTQDGKELVQARYGLRNNLRSFAKIDLPQGAVLWSASQEGKPVHPGRSADGGLLFPLEKGRAGEEAPAFAIEVLYLARAKAWNDRGRATVALPAVDLPVSKTEALLYYPPAYRVAAEPGAFRTQPGTAADSPGPPGLPGAFPEVGPSLLLASELTGEKQVPRVELSYQKERRGGVR